MSTNPMDEMLQLVAEAPHSAPALTLYALVSTLEYESAGCLFKLTKLRDLEPAHRRLAYDVIELMVAGANHGQDWDLAKARLDELVRGG